VLRRLVLGISWTSWLVTGAYAQKTLTWEDAKRVLLSSNPNIGSGQIAVDESRAEEVTAFLRPNPSLSMSVDQLNPFTGSPYQPLTNTLPLFSFSYLHERQHKRELRLESARQGTAIATSQLADQERNLLFDLRNSFVLVLQQKAVVNVTRENLQYYDQVLQVSRDRLQVGDIAQVDLDRLELQRVQFEADFQTALVSLRNAKIQLLAMLNDRTAVETFDVAGHFEAPDVHLTEGEFEQMAFEGRPDFRGARQAVEKAKTDSLLAVANGSTDPTFEIDFARDPPIPAFFGVSATIPLRIFDRNQGEKTRTRLDIERQRRLVEAVRAQVISDVGSAYATLQSTLLLLRPYKTQYLQQAARVRETISFSYRKGGASLLDFLQAQQEFRNIQLNYLNLVGASMTAANQLNFAAGREVIQ
jgi:outer membrane protein, heavy metal efflux system